MGGMALERFVRQVDYTMKDATLCKRPGKNVGRLFEALPLVLVLEPKQGDRRASLTTGGVEGGAAVCYDWIASPSSL